jgi:hypothetical protein
MMASSFQDPSFYSVSEGHIHFVSEAPLELIEAESNELNGILSSENQSFAFSVPIISFVGFNSPLQREHFNENYMETDSYDKATFTGTIIEDLDLLTPGIIVARAKGKFKIHGVEHVQLLNVLLKVTKEQIEVETEFDVLLEDYKINIPRIVNKKIAKTIHVTVNATLKKK